MSTLRKNLILRKGEDWCSLQLLRVRDRLLRSGMPGIWHDGWWFGLFIGWPLVSSFSCGSVIFFPRISGWGLSHRLKPNEPREGVPHPGVCTFQFSLPLPSRVHPRCWVEPCRRWWWKGWCKWPPALVWVQSCQRRGWPKRCDQFSPFPLQWVQK